MVDPGKGLWAVAQFVAQFLAHWVSVARPADCNRSDAPIGAVHARSIAASGQQGSRPAGRRRSWLQGSCCRPIRPDEHRSRGHSLGMPPTATGTTPVHPELSGVVAAPAANGAAGQDRARILLPDGSAGTNGDSRRAADFRHGHRRGVPNAAVAELRRAPTRMVAPVVTAQVWLPPEATVVASGTPGTATGVELPVPPPSPSCPKKDATQHRIMPSARSAHAKSRPAETAVASVMPGTVTGVVSSTPLDSPSTIAAPALDGAAGQQGARAASRRRWRRLR